MNAHEDMVDMNDLFHQQLNELERRVDETKITRQQENLEAIKTEFRKCGYENWRISEMYSEAPNRVLA